MAAKQQNFSKTNLKAMNVALEQTLKEAPKVDVDTINKRKQMRLAKSITEEKTMAK